MDFEITKREAVFSIIIVALMLIIGFMISATIDDYNVDQVEKYIKAIDITDKDTFEYGMQTNVGNAFLYGEIKAVDSVSYPLLKDKKYIQIEKDIEKYTKHTRQVSHKDSKGRTYYTTETYWTWDRIGYEKKSCKEITILGVKFKRDIVDLNSEYIDTIKTGYHLREKYYGVPAIVKGTIFATLKDNNLKEPYFYRDDTIKEARENLEQNSFIVKGLFWMFWIGCIAGAVYGFVYLDNKWLEG